MRALIAGAALLCTGATQDGASYGKGYKSAEDSFRAIAAHNGRSVLQAKILSRESVGGIEITLAQGQTAEDYFYGVYTVNNRTNRPYCVYPYGNLLPYSRNRGTTLLWSQARTEYGRRIYYVGRGEFSSLYIGRLNAKRSTSKAGLSRDGYSVRSTMVILAWPQDTSRPADPCKSPPISTASWAAGKPTVSTIYH